MTLILDSENNLSNFLGNIKKSKISIITAFASGTEGIIDTLIENNNEVEIIIGTINAFSSPEFIDSCLEKKILLSVDFRYQDSIHWKIYLINPGTVIIGSANFTSTGVGLSRDTCVVIEDVDVYTSYIHRVEELKNTDCVLHANHKDFRPKLDIYRDMHLRIQSRNCGIHNYTNIKEWLSNEANQIIPLLIWCDVHSKETEQIAKNLLEKEELENIPTWYDFFTCDINDHFPYRQGDIVLCTKQDGCYIEFSTFDRIIKNGDTYYIYTYSKRSRTPPFILVGTNFKRQLKEMIPKWYDQEKTYITRNDIQDILTNNA